MRLDEGDYLAHYGILRKSGRYPWGSGDTPHQRSKSFLEMAADLKKNHGMSEAEIAKAFSPVDKDGNPIKEFQLSVADLRAIKSRTGTIVKQEQIRTAQRLRDKGMGPSAIARQMDLNESTVRSLLEPGRQNKLDILESTANMLKREVKEKGLIDVGANVERDLPIGMGENPGARIGISADKFKTALSMLKEEGYNVHPVHIKQVGTGEITRHMVLCPPGMTRKEAFANRDKIRQITEKSDDGGRTFADMGFKPPLSIDAKRVGVKYKEDGGADADGVIYVRPGVPDVSLGKARYAQVRIAVGGTHYLKGMAVYKDDLPKGVDLQFNTNKSSTGNKLDAMKDLKKDKDTGEVDQSNPFGAVIKVGGQILGKDGKPSSVMNLVNEEGDWDNWSRKISSQVLSKQNPDMAKSQLDITYDRRRDELARINALTNPLIKRKLLETFGNETDAAAVHLKAANMPRQANKVLLPSNHVKPNEIYAPTFKDGERVVLIRYPHAGTFEIPELTVNNRGREARKQLPTDSPDAVLIHPRVAERLSGADFDGDAVVVIPNNRGSIKHTPALEGLKGFDPQSAYPPYDGLRTIDGGTYNAKTRKVEYGVDKDGKPRSPNTSKKQQQMGDVTNLISDMTIRGASGSEIARAVRHSMVVIDSEKHNLDYKASARDNGIIQLKRDYQGVNPKSGQARGAATLITRAGSQAHPEKRKAGAAGPGRTRVSSKTTIEDKTGKKVWDPTGELKPDGSPATFRSKKLAETDDAYTLISKGRETRIEQIYADHSNKMKALANEARRDYVAVPTTKKQPSAAKVYAHEVKSLEAKLDDALKNSPRERQAQVVANTIVAQKKRANPNMEKDEERKIRGMALTEARLRTGANKARLGSDKAPITDREWDAIQAGAISNHKMEKILQNSDLDAIRERATPRTSPVMTTAITAHAKRMLSAGYTLEEVSDYLNIPTSTISSGVE